MKTEQMEPHFRKAVAEIDQDIVQLDTDRARLMTTRETIVELYGGETELPAAGELRPKAAKAAKTGRSAASVTRKTEGGGAGKSKASSAPLAADGEPESLGAAMKKVIRELKSFKWDQLREIVKERYKQLFEEVGAGAFSANLNYWTKTGKLTQDGETYTVTESL